MMRMTPKELEAIKRRCEMWTGVPEVRWRSEYVNRYILDVYDLVAEVELLRRLLVDTIALAATENITFDFDDPVYERIRKALGEE